MSLARSWAALALFGAACSVTLTPLHASSTNKPRASGIIHYQRLWQGCKPLYASARHCAQAQMQCRLGYRQTLGRCQYAQSVKLRSQANLCRRPTAPARTHIELLSGRRSQRRCFGLASIPTVLLPPVVFGGLLITLWTYKCLMMIIFQNKIIYMPSMPPFSRSEKVEDYANGCKPVIWKEHQTKSLDGVKLVLLEGGIPPGKNACTAGKHVVVVYFQGNGSSLPPRLPYLSNILKLLHSPESDSRYTIVALSYRGFWKSKGRPSQKGIEMDAQAALKWVLNRYGDLPSVETVLWGQSIGAGVATVAAAALMGREPHRNNDSSGLDLIPSISGLLLETPFTSLQAMLIALYPQKFLPYRYLGPFLMSTWDSSTALAKVGEQLKVARGSEVRDSTMPLRVLILEAGDDELVPIGDAERLLAVCQKSDAIEVQHQVVPGALHTDVMMKGQGKKQITSFLRKFGDT